MMRRGRAYRYRTIATVVLPSALQRALAHLQARGRQHRLPGIGRDDIAPHLILADARWIPSKGDGFVRPRRQHPRLGRHDATALCAATLISNVARVVLPSALSVPSPICRREAASIACMASGATTSLHTSYLPTRAGYFPKATDLSDPAANIIVLRPPPLGSDSRTNISRARSLFSQNSRHSIVRNDAPSPCFAAAILRTYGRDAASSVHAVSGKGRVSMPKR